MAETTGNNNGRRLNDWLLGLIAAALLAGVPVLIQMWGNLKLIEYRLGVLERAFTQVHPEAAGQVGKAEK